MEITFNNHTKKIAAETSVALLLAQLIGEQQKGIAVAINETVIPKQQWESYTIQPNDKVLVIKATQGG